MSDAQWRRLTETSTRRLPDGRVTPHYDPAMVMQFTHHDDDYDLWDAWDALDMPVLCLRGDDSDLLLPETAEQMRKRGPRAVVVEIAGCGHAPALNTPEQFALVERFLAAPDAAPQFLQHPPGAQTIDEPPRWTPDRWPQVRDALTLQRHGPALCAGRRAARSAPRFPAGFPVIDDASLGKPVIGFGAAGPVDAHAGDLPARQQRHAVRHRLQPPTAACSALAQYLADRGYATERAVGPGLPGRPVRPGGRQDAALGVRAHRHRQRARPAPLRARRCWPTPARRRSTSSATAWA